ncbi:MAG: hypothetical protein QM607_03420 [Microbacterium sp.]
MAAAEQPTPAVRIVVSRTGGVAGITRRWCVERDDADADGWRDMVEQCPWDEEPDTDDSVPRTDRFVWRIDAELPCAHRERTLDETQVEGAWRELIDAVRDAAD